ncbi:MAG: DUF4403 family protein [Saprospiraceae bacterium]|nr:DUF4403 family protein [Saprospiraceae bacterium]
MKTPVIILITGLLIAGCGTKNRNSMNGFSIDPDNPPISEVRIPIQIDLKTLERDLNEQLGDILFEDDKADGADLHIRASKRGPIKLEVIENGIEYTVPMDLWLKKPYRLANVEGEGSVDVRLRTTYDIGSDWEFVTATRVLEHEWLSKPKLKVGVVKLPVEAIADKALERSRELIEQAIDGQIAQQVNLQAEIQNAWNQFYQPFVLSEEYACWMMLKPLTLGMTPLISDGRSWTATLVLTAYPEVYIGEEPDYERPPALPTFQWKQAAENNFNIFIRTEVSYEQAERLARESLIGETFSQGSRDVTVTGIDIYGKGNKIAVETTLAGAFNGVVELLMKPKYVKSDQAFEIELEKIEVRTGNILHKSIAWLMKSKLQKELKKQLDSFLNDNLDILRNTVQGQIHSNELGNGVRLDGNLSKLDVLLALVKTDYLELWIGMNGNLGVEFAKPLNE